MSTEVINICLGFVEGLGLILSPCILPILPLILSGSLAGSKKRPFGIVCGFVVMFALFTFFSRAIVRLSGIDLNVIRYISYGLLLLFGIVMLSTYLTEKFSLWTARFANVGSNAATLNDVQGGFGSGFLFGCLVALIWTPCAGPILAAVIVQTVIQQTTWVSFLIVLAFGLGSALPMLFIVLFGRKLMTKLSFFKTHSMLLRKLLGVIVIASVVYMIYSGGAATSFAANSSTHEQSGLSLQNGIASPYPAPEIAGITAWINSSPLTMQALKGHVVLIDFWTYSCINCVRTLPYVKAWYSHYHEKGLVIIGVHAPEFDFEKNLANVQAAVKADGILYPVALDNNFVTWRNFQNSYWPAEYLIDKNGTVVYQHFGEGDDDVMENNIRYLLHLNTQAEATVINQADVSVAGTPETYLGYARQENFASPDVEIQNQTANYTFPTELSENAWALRGAWKIVSDRIISMAANDELKIHFNARKVYVVMGNATNQPITVNVLFNGEKVLSVKGKDVVNSTVVVAKHTLFEVISLPTAQSGILLLQPDVPGLEVYTFTFG